MTTEHLPIQKQKAALAWFSVEAGHLPLRGQVRQEYTDLCRAHIRRVAFAVEQDETLYPVEVRLLGALAVCRPAATRACDQADPAAWKMRDQLSGKRWVVPITKSIIEN